MTATTTVQTVPAAIITATTMPLLGNVTTTAPTNPESSLGTILGLFTHRDAELAEQLAQDALQGRSAEDIAECAEIPAATITAYMQARAALLAVELPAEVVAAFKQAQAAFLAADAAARDCYK